MTLLHMTSARKSARLELLLISSPLNIHETLARILRELNEVGIKVPVYCLSVRMN